jgi:hypothetical protein
MRLNTSSSMILTRVAPVVAVALLFVQCSSDGPDNADASLNGTTLKEQQRADSIRMSQGETRNADGTWSTANTADRTMTDNDASNRFLYPGERPTPATPAEERAMANADMSGLRAILMADLEMVRARLNDGTRTTEQKATDQALAGELAQGLERVDRALVAMDATTDKTWNDMRTSHLKEVEEVRTWMVGYREKGQLRG